MTGQQVYQ